MRQLLTSTVALVSTAFFCLTAVHGQTIAPGQVYFISDSSKKTADTYTDKFLYTDLFSTKIVRAFAGEVILFYEHIDNNGRGNEFGFSYVYPTDGMFSFFTDFPPYQGDFQLTGFGLWYSRKYYNKKKSLTYLAPEIAFHYKYGDDMGWDGGPNHHVDYSQRRYITSLAAKWGKRNKSGILDFYIGIGISIRHTETTFLNPPPPACQCEGSYESQISNANGFSVFPVLRSGIKIGFPISKRKSSSTVLNDSTITRKFKHKDYLSINLLRILLGEIIIHEEHINKKGRGIEKGVGIVYPFNQRTFTNSGDGTYQLYGLSLWLSEKFYFAEKSLFYSSPELSLYLEHNGNMRRTIWYKNPSHVSQSRIIPAITLKEGWRDRSGIVDLYIGAGAAFRYTQTSYLDEPPASCNCTSEQYYGKRNDNGWYIYPLIRGGVKLGFPFKTGKKG